MNNKEISYKNSYKYEFIYLHDSLSIPQKSKYISYRNNISDMNNKEYKKFYKTHKNFNITNKNSHSFHKSLLHLKLSLNPKYKNNEKICLTERNLEQKRENDNFKNQYEKIFLTNTDTKTLTIQRTKKLNPLILITEYNNKYNKKNYEDKHINIPANTFLSYGNNKYLYFVHDITKEKVSEFIEDSKMVRTAKFINNIKNDRKKKKMDLSELKIKENKINIQSLKKTSKLLDIYKRCFGEYNKFLINEIKREKKILNDYSEKKKSLEDQVNILQKQFDDIIKELEAANNFKNIFTAIKNKKKIEDFNQSSKQFIEDLLKKLKEKIFRKRELIISKTKRITIKRSQNEKSKGRKKSLDNFLNIKLQSQKNINSVKKEERKDSKKDFRRSSTILMAPKKLKKKSERFNSLQPFTSRKKKLVNTFNNNIFGLDFDIEKNENFILDNILKLMHEYNNVNSEMVDLKVTYEKEENDETNKKHNKYVNNQNNDLLYEKNNYKTSLAKFKILHHYNKDYSLHFAIYRKINDMISSIIKFKVKKFNSLIDNLRKIYDKNKLFYTYYYNQKESNTRKTYFEQELFAYIHNGLLLIEQLLYQLINQKNIYLKSDLYQEKILEYESKMDTAKKIINNREKRTKDILRKEKIYEQAIQKSNKIIFRSFRKIPRNYPCKIQKRLNTDFDNNEDEKWFLY